jgi:ABC-type transporter Mla maintaining outer membrane lipid asymmetry ATPase subunit MlaF
VKGTLFWRELQLGRSVVPASHVGFGEHVRLVMDVQYQYAFMQHLFTMADYPDEHTWEIWLETESASYHTGTAEFITRLGSMIRHQGLLSNLSLRENLLLPFLYRGDQGSLEQAMDELEDVANWLGLSAILDQQAGERTTYIHALVSLGRCLLLKPSIIVAQEVHIGMSPDHLDHFRALSMAALKRLGAGLLYLTASPNEAFGLEFSRTLTVEANHESFKDSKETL